MVREIWPIRDIDFCEPSTVSETCLLSLLTFDTFLLRSLFLDIVTRDPGLCCSETFDKCFLCIFDRYWTREPGFDSNSFLRRIKSYNDEVFLWPFSLPSFSGDFKTF
jgi:hypothetical protein